MIDFFDKKHSICLISHAQRGFSFFLDFEDRCTLFDCLIFCRFYRDFYPWEEISKIIALTTGLELNKSELERLAARVTKNTRRFNIQEELTIADDQLTKRLLKESLKEGRRNTAEEMETLLQDYYRQRGWNKEGIPPGADE